MKAKMSKSKLVKLYERLDALAAEPPSAERKEKLGPLLKEIEAEKAVELERWKKEVRDPMIQHEENLREALEGLEKLKKKLF